MKFYNIKQEDWDKVIDIARHLGRENELRPCIYDGYDAAVCERKKPTDRQFHILNSDQKDLIVVMDMEDINYEEPMLVGRTYLCMLHDNKSYYRVYVKSICDNIITADYQPFEDKELTKPLHSVIKSTEWQVEWITEYREIT